MPGPAATTSTTKRRQRVRPRPRWSYASVLTASTISLAAAVTWCPCSASDVVGSLGAERVRRRRRLVDALESVDATAILREIGQIDCPDSVSASIRGFFDVNKVVVDACTDQTGYTLYPYGTKLPDPEQTARICASPNCMDLLSGVVLAKLPECEYQRYSPRSFAESFLRVRVDLQNGRRPPTASEFSPLYALSRVVNYLTENTTIQASVKTDFKAGDVLARMAPVQVNPDVVLSDELVVMVNPSLADSSGVVHAAQNSSDTTTTPTTTTTPSVTPSVTPSPGAGSNSTELSKTSGSGRDDDPPENLQMAYLYLGLLWLFINVLYHWTMIRKGSDDY